VNTRPVARSGHCSRSTPARCATFADVRDAWRHLPLADVYPHAERTALVSAAAADPGAFWEMHDP
jgi:hypothetical protein